MAYEPFSISERTPGAILQPHPPPWERLVSFGSFMNDDSFFQK